MTVLKGSAPTEDSILAIDFVSHSIMSTNSCEAEVGRGTLDRMAFGTIIRSTEDGYTERTEGRPRAATLQSYS